MIINGTVMEGREGYEIDVGNPSKMVAIPAQHEDEAEHWLWWLVTVQVKNGVWYFSPVRFRGV